MRDPNWDADDEGEFYDGDLIDASGNGDLVRVKELLKQRGKNVNVNGRKKKSPSGPGDGPLHRACKKRHFDIVKLPLSQTINFSFRRVLACLSFSLSPEAPHFRLPHFLFSFSFLVQPAWCRSQYRG